MSYLTYVFFKGSEVVREKIFNKIIVLETFLREGGPNFLTLGPGFSLGGLHTTQENRHHMESHTANRGPKPGVTFVYYVTNSSTWKRSVLHEVANAKIIWHKDHSRQSADPGLRERWRNHVEDLCPSEKLSSIHMSAIVVVVTVEKMLN